jgi:hypothetical protein
LKTQALGAVQKLWKRLREKCELQALELCLSAKVLALQHSPPKFHSGKPLDEMWKSRHFAV